MGRRPLVDQPVRSVLSDMVLVAEPGAGELDRWECSILMRLRLRVFDRPATIPVFLAEPLGLVDEPGPGWADSPPMAPKSGALLYGNPLHFQQTKSALPFNYPL